MRARIVTSLKDKWPDALFVSMIVLSVGGLIYALVRD